MMAERRPEPEFVQGGQFSANAALTRSTDYLRHARASIEALANDSTVTRGQSLALKRIVDEIEEYVRAANAERDAGGHRGSD